MKTTILSLALICLPLSFTARAEEVEYKIGKQNYKGYFSSKVKKGERKPGIIVVHEWWGHNDYARKRADMLADLGYVAMSIDLYGDGKVADHPKDAGAFAGMVKKNMPLTKRKFETALSLLKMRKDVDRNNIAAIGYCFGGGIVLHMARQGVELKGVASFHGSLKPLVKARKGAVKAAILVLNGAKDKMITPRQIDAFKKEMKAAGVDFKLINYPGALHAFTNPQATELGKKFKLPVAYHAEADKKSWEEMQKFFKKIFKTGK